ncbi:MAG: hypothetical protein NVSMB9_33620 [Isosphaeraceae bacterium]
MAAMAIEVGFLTDRLTKIRKYSGPSHSVIEGESGGKLVALIISGMGRASARRATEILLDGHQPRCVISAGFAGALDPALKRNEVVFPDEVVDLHGGRVAVDPRVRSSLEGQTPRFRAGRLLTVDTLIRTAAEKAELRERHGADIVDMETSAVATLCGERNVCFCSLRIVSDEAGVDLPREIATLMTHTGSYRVGAALRAIWHRPSSLKDFWALHEQAQEAADHLAQVTVNALAHLPA